jgi:hypothetical protein
MLLRLASSLLVLTLSSTAGYSETINLRNACAKWEHIPANKALKSPVAALLQCTDDDNTWLSLQIMCFTETAEIEFRYRPGYPIVSPIPPGEKTAEPTVITVAQADDSLVAIPIEEMSEPSTPPLAEKEMLFFDFPKVGVTNVVKYDFNSKDWGFFEKEPLSPLFMKLISGNYADVSLLATGVTERLPLRGSTKALRPVVEACRIAKINLERAAEEAAKLTQD